MKANGFILVVSVQAVALARATQGQSLEHANHIFNTVHSAMRQWGSSLLHNGMTAFVATVPADTTFYHGTSSEYRVNGTEWLAFEPEHALLFARPEPHLQSFGKNQPLAAEDTSQHTARRSSWFGKDGRQLRFPGTPVAIRQQRLQGQRPGHDTYHLPGSDEYGYLHTYRTKHALRLLYLDGQSAAKSTKGTLDLQDIVILNNSLPNYDPDRPPRDGLPMFEGERVASLCERAKKQWRDRIDGILRMEGGFEIVLCSFERHLDLVRITQAKPRWARMLSADSSLVAFSGTSNDMLNYYKAVAARYDGIGNQRVKLDLNHFVSLFAYPSAVLFDITGRPRVNNESAELDDARKAIDHLSLRLSDEDSTDWQATADMVVARYSDRIEVLTSGELQSLANVKAELEYALLPFIDHSDRDATEEIRRCTDQFLQQKDGQTLPLAAIAIRNVTGTICQELSRASQMHDLNDINRSLLQLRAWLGWTTWKRCRGCAANEVCLVPIWPLGTAKDFDNPRCTSDPSEHSGKNDYWRD